MDLELSRSNGFALMALFVGLVVYLIRASSSESSKQENSGVQDKLEERAIPLGKSIQYLVVGLAVIALCSALLVWSARGIVTNLGITELVAGVVILAFA